MKLELRQIARWCSAELDDKDAEGLSAAGYSIDSRTIVPGELFFAVKGERFDGHDFVGGAFTRGAVAAVAYLVTCVNGLPALPSPVTGSWLTGA